jgi:hypothetical protein
LFIRIAFVRCGVAASTVTPHPPPATGADIVLAVHFTKVGRLMATTLVTVRFEPPHKIHFRLVRGPVPRRRLGP